MRQIISAWFRRLQRDQYSIRRVIGWRIHSSQLKCRSWNNRLRREKMAVLCLPFHMEIAGSFWVERLGLKCSTSSVLVHLISPCTCFICLFIFFLRAAFSGSPAFDSTEQKPIGCGIHAISGLETFPIIGMNEWDLRPGMNGWFWSF